ncbi:MAG TPA: hypothetical protein VM598_14825 [Bdellovibrionota bacterium]|nr:hypothetical protein [Bdellovibrionota bacterium]
MFFVQTLALLLALGGCSSAPKLERIVGEPPKVTIELTHLALDEWQVEYVLSRFVTGLVFADDDDGFRKTHWKPSLELTAWSGDHVVCTRPAGCDRFQFRFKTTLQPFAENYEFFHAFKDGARTVFLRYLRVRPWICTGPPGSAGKDLQACTQNLQTMSETMTLLTRLPERIYANGIATEVQRFNVRGQRRYAYFGRGRIIDQQWKDEYSDYEARVTSWIIDEEMPGWIKELVPRKLPAIFGVLASDVSKKFPITTELLLGYESSADRNLELRGGNIRGQVQATLSGRPWMKRSTEGVRRLVTVLVHELAHTWTSQIPIRAKGASSSWVEEGGTDALAYVAARRSGFIGEQDHKDLWTSAINRCLIGLSGRNPLNLEPGPDGGFNPLYSCGSVLWLTAGRLVKPRDPVAGVLELWNFTLFDHKERELLTENLVLGGWKRRGLHRPSIERIERIASSASPERPAWLKQALKEAGVKLAPARTITDEGTRSDLALSLLNRILPEACKGVRAFPTERGFSVQPKEGCPLFAQATEIRTIGGVSLADPLKAHDRAASECGRKKKVELGGSRKIKVECGKIGAKPAIYTVMSL